MSTRTMLETAIEAAQHAGAQVEKYFETTGLERNEKDDTSFVTKADTEAEEVIVSLIRERFPDHGILGEEGSEVNSEAEYQWVIDPIDGTRNFTNGIPLFAVSIAVLYQGEPVVGVVYNPATHSLYAAEKGKGATFNGAPMRVSVQDAKKGVVTFGPGQGDAKEKLRAFFQNGEHYFRSVRYLGCTALELAYVARGGTEGFVCIGLKPWDYAAGRVLLLEAGGTITDYEGKACGIEQNYFIASNGVAHEALRALVSGA